MPRRADRDFVVEAADPGELQRVDHGRRLAEQRVEGDAADGDPDGGAVRRRDVVDVVHRLPPAARRHVAEDDVRIAWNVFADVPPEQPAVLVIAAAGRRADEHVDLLAFVELGAGCAAAPPAARMPASASRRMPRTHVMTSSAGSRRPALPACRHLLTCVGCPRSRALRQVVHAGLKPVEEFERLGRLHHVGIFRVHVAEIDGVARL